MRSLLTVLGIPIGIVAVICVVAIGKVGGAVGVLLGVAVSVIGSRVLGRAMQLSVEAVVLAALFSIAVGAFFGYYPARKVPLLDPIDALRYE
jgi:putative ABC transport system permease protein